MILALEAMDPVFQGFLFLVAVILFVLAAFLFGRGNLAGMLLSIALACATFVFMWNAFAAS